MVASSYPFGLFVCFSIYHVDFVFMFFFRRNISQCNDVCLSFNKGLPKACCKSTIAPPLTWIAHVWPSSHEMIRTCCYHPICFGDFSMYDEQFSMNLRHLNSTFDSNKSFSISMNDSQNFIIIFHMQMLIILQEKWANDSYSISWPLASISQHKSTLCWNFRYYYIQTFERNAFHSKRKHRATHAIWCT